MIFVQKVKNASWLLHFLPVDRNNYNWMNYFNQFLPVVFLHNRLPSNFTYNECSFLPGKKQSPYWWPLCSLSIESLKGKVQTALLWKWLCLNWMKPHRKKIYNSFFFFFKFNQCHKMGGVVRTLQESPIFPLFKEFTPVLLSSPLFLLVCLFLYLIFIFFTQSCMAVPGHFQSIPKQTSPPLKFSVQIPWLPPHLISKCLVIMCLAGSQISTRWNAMCKKYILWPEWAASILKGKPKKEMSNVRFLEPMISLLW